MFLSKKDLKLLGWNHFSKLFDTWVLNWYEFMLFHKIFKKFDDNIVFISANEKLNPVYRLTFTAEKLKELFGLWKGYIKILFKNDEAYLYLSRDNIIKLWNDVVLVENLVTARNFFSDDIVDENRCYYLSNFYEGNCSFKKKSFLRIEFFKPWFFYLQDFSAFMSDNVDWFWRSWGWNDKYELKCSDVIELMNNEKFNYEENLDINDDELLPKFSSDEIKIIKFISYLYNINEKSFNRIIYYLKKNVACDMVEWVRWD